VDNPEKTVEAPKGGQSRENRGFCAPAVFSGLSFFMCPYSFLWIFRPCMPLRFSLDCSPLCVPTKDNPEKTAGTHKRGKSRENRRGTQGWTIQRKPWRSLLFSLDCPFLCALTVFSGLSTFVCPYGFHWIFHSCVPLRFSLDCPPLYAPTVFSQRKP
jgi:hypothetical protein